MPREVKIHSVKYNFMMNFILTASSFIFPLVTFPYVARVLGAAGNGEIAFASSVANYFMMVASLGIPTYGIRACARVREDKDELSMTAQEILLINLAVTLLTAFTYLACVFLVPDFREEKALFLINGLNVILNMFGANWLYQALEQYDYITFRNILFKVVSIVLMFVLVHAEEDYVVYAAITVFASVGSNVLNFVRLPRLMKFKRYEGYNFKRHMKPILTLFAQNLAVSVYTNLDTVMLGFMKSSDVVGYYNAATKLKGLQLSLVMSLGTVLLPRMSVYAKKDDSEHFEGLMVKALNFTACLAIAVVAYCIVESADMVGLLAGQGYDPAIPAMQIITLAVIANGISGVLGTQTLIALGKESVVLRSVTVGAVVDFVLNLALIPVFDASGAALSTMMTEFTVVLIQAIALKSMLARNWKRIFLLRYALCGAFSALICVLIGQACVALPTVARLVVTFIGFDVAFLLPLLAVKDEFVLSFVRIAKGKIGRRRVDVCK